MTPWPVLSEGPKPTSRPHGQYVRAVATRLSETALLLVGMLCCQGCEATLTLPAPTAVISQPVGETGSAATQIAMEPTAQPLAGTITPTLSQTPEPIGRIVIPSVGIDAPIVQVSWHIEEVEGQQLAVWDVAQNAAGHHLGTAALGDEGNCVITGHSRTDEGAVFRNLEQVQPGDEVVVRWSSEGERIYLVEQVQQVAEVGASLAERLANAACMAPSEETQLTLITCWPDWAYTHRVIVVARPQ